MILTNEDRDALFQIQLLLAGVLKRVTLSELEEQHERNFELQNHNQLFRGEQYKEFTNQNDGLNIETAFAKITKELKRMPKKFIEIFNREWFEKHLRRKPSGIYEIRFMLNGNAISGAGKTVDIAAENFIKRLAAIGSEKKKNTTKRMLFCEFAEKWFKLIKKPVIKPDTYSNYFNVYCVHIQPYFKSKYIDGITAMQIQPLLLKLERKKIYTTLRHVKLILTQIFQSAVGERLIPFNPMDGVHVLKHQAKKSEALSIDDEFKLISTDCCYRLSFIILLFGGMRRGELHTARLEDGFIIVANGKIKAGREQTERKIPITPMLARYLEGVSKKEFKEAVSVTPDVLSRAFKTKVCANHHLHELRHTFITRCQECGVPREVVSVWAGHAADKTMTSTVYTHFSDEFMRNEGKKVDYFGRLYNR